MAISFSIEELAASVTLLGTGIVAFANLRARITSQGQRLEAVELEVDELKKKQVAVALLQQTVASFAQSVEAMNTEHRLTRATLEQMGKSLVRIETKLEMEQRPTAGA